MIKIVLNNHLYFSNLNWCFYGNFICGFIYVLTTTWLLKTWSMYAKGKGSTVPSDAQAREKYDFIFLNYMFCDLSCMYLNCLLKNFKILNYIQYFHILVHYNIMNTYLTIWSYNKHVPFTNKIQNFKPIIKGKYYNMI